MPRGRESYSVFSLCSRNGTHQSEHLEPGNNRAKENPHLKGFKMKMKSFLIWYPMWMYTHSKNIKHKLQFPKYSFLTTS